MASRSHLLRLLAVVAVGALALALRLRAVDRLPIDFDEDDYLLAGQHYAAALVAGDWAEISHYDYNYEHPPLPKLVYGLALAALPPAPEIPDLPTSAPPARSLPRPHFHVARLTSALFGTLEVLALALFNPLAGLFLALHTWQIKYTSQIMIEALPALVSALAVLCYLRSKGKWNAWLALSALALGLTAASKYLYCAAGLAILIHWLWQSFPKNEPRTRSTVVRRLAPIAGWGLLSLVVFVAADPYLWPDPAGRLARSLLYHQAYATGSVEVDRASFPIWQPLVWLSGPVPWHPGVFVFSLDLFITLLAALGLQRLWSKQPLFVIWLGVALGFLLVWPTKWPQYILVLTVPLSMAAAEGFAGRIWQPIAARWGQRRGVRPARPAQELAPDARRALPWLVPGAAALLLITFFPLVYQGAMALTDFKAVSIRDGINGGVWREVWLGLTGQKAPTPVDLFASRPSTVREVRYAGPGLLVQLFSGQSAEILFFNVMWAVLSVGLQALLGLGVALLLHQRGVRFAAWWRAIFIVPWAIPEFVGALIWLRIVDPSFGWLTQALPAGVSVPSFFQDPNFALLLLLVAATWYGFPLIMLAATAGLKLVPRDVYDAAAMDGAGAWTQFRFVTWPLLWPLLAPAIIVRSIFAFNQFYLLWVTQAPWPLATFATVSYYVFSNFGGGHYGVSAAINIFTVVVLLILIVWFSRRSHAAEGVTYA